METENREPLTEHHPHAASQPENATASAAPEPDSGAAADIAPQVAEALNIVGLPASPEETAKVAEILQATINIERSTIPFPSPDILIRMNDAFEGGGRAGFDATMKEQDFRHERIRNRDAFAQDMTRDTELRSFELAKLDQASNHRRAERGQLIVAGLGAMLLAIAYSLFTSGSDGVGFLFSIGGAAAFLGPFIYKETRKDKTLPASEENPQLPPETSK